VRRLRTFTLFGAMLAVAAAASPAGAFHEAFTNGTTGLYTVNDFNGSPGITCKFESNPGAQNDELNRIKVKQVHTHGPFAQKTWVGFRFIVKRNSPPFGDEQFRTVFRSPIQKAKANQTDVAFFKGGWNAPEGANGQYRVHVFFYYYAQGSKTQVIGRVRGLEEVYRHAMSGAAAYVLGSEGDAGFCRRNFHGL
jgi:hypothetical protein